MIIVQYLDLSRSFGLTNRRNRGLVRQLDLHKISTAFEALISRRVITAQSIHDEFADLSRTGCQRLIYSNKHLRRLNLAHKQVVIARRIRDDFACLVFAIKPLFRSQIFYVVFQFHRGSPCQVFARFSINDSEESVALRCYGGTLQLCEKMYCGLTVSVQLWIRKMRVLRTSNHFCWRQERYHCVRCDVSFTRRLRLAINQKCCVCTSTWHPQNTVCMQDVNLNAQEMGWNTNMVMEANSK